MQSARDNYRNFTQLCSTHDTQSTAGPRPHRRLSVQNFEESDSPEEMSTLCRKRAWKPSLLLIAQVLTLVNSLACILNRLFSQSEQLRSWYTCKRLIYGGQNSGKASYRHYDSLPLSLSNSPSVRSGGGLQEAVGAKRIHSDRTVGHQEKTSAKGKEDRRRYWMLRNEEPFFAPLLLLWSSSSQTRQGRSSERKRQWVLAAALRGLVHR